MRLLLTLNTTDNNPVLPINYQYPLSAVIYKIIQRADARYAEFLHNKGYGAEHKHFKLFTFSDLTIPFKIQQDRLLLTGREAKLIICFHIPEAMENFVKGLFVHQQFEIADIKSRVQFTVSQVEMIPVLNGIHSSDKEVTVQLQPLSPVVAGMKNDKGNYDYLSPLEPAFKKAIVYNWKEKYATLYGQAAAEAVFSKLQLEVTQAHDTRSRLITIKANTEQQTRIRGFTHFKLNVQAPKLALELAMGAGLGLYNSQGMGCVGVCP
ncbi:MAG: CRISPR-associated endoribonuclease Cas6 [Sediminibacterium sp.]|nr:CRISPR-associated endoribonuclease Cas6 [Sediminibacterium sp.]